MRLLLFFSLFFLGLMSCKKAEITTPEMPSTANTIDISKQTLVVEGKFTDGAHPTSGTAKVYKDSNGKLSLLLENFKTDAGPDLRIYLAEDKAVTNFIEITSTVKNGTSMFTLPSSVDLSKQKVALIWCKQFAVLFGSAELK